MDGITAVTVTAIIGVLIWYLKYTTKRQAIREDKQDLERTARQKKRDEEQKEERDYYRGILTNEMGENKKLNVQGIALQKEMVKDFKDHNGHAERFSQKVIETLGTICNKMNGNNPGDRRKETKSVEVDRRK